MYSTMEKINLILFFLFFSSLIVFDVAVNRSSFIVDGRLRVLSEMAMLSVMAADFIFSGRSVSIQMFDACLALGNSFLLVIPPSFVSAKRPAVSILAAWLLSLFVISPFCRLSSIVTRAAVIAVISQMVIAVNLVLSAADRFSSLNLFLKRSNAPQNTSDMERMLYTLAMSLLVSLSMGMLNCPERLCRWGEECIAVLLMLMMGVVYYMASTGRGAIFENRMFRLRHSGSEEVPECDDRHGSKLSMEELYSKILEYMTQYQPFLNEKFNLSDLALAMGTNKTYVSRTVNVMFGNNFCQFVNYYRIRYAVDLMKKNRSLKMLDVSIMSGFHSVASFNMAFKLNMNDLPSEFIRNVHSQSLSIPEGLEP